MSVHDKLMDIDEYAKDISEVLDTVKDLIGETDSIDTRLREVIAEVDNYKDDFEDFTIKEIKSFLEDLERKLTDIREDIY